MRPPTKKIAEDAADIGEATAEKVAEIKTA
jgi:hypothetical protein